jgi:hypothetical protein
MMKVHLLSAGLEQASCHGNRTIEITVPTIHSHEVVALDFAVEDAMPASRPA